MEALAALRLGILLTTLAICVVWWAALNEFDLNMGTKIISRSSIIGGKVTFEFTIMKGDSTEVPETDANGGIY